MRGGVRGTRPRGPWSSAAAAALLAWTVAPAGLRGQATDIEAVARMRGLTVPAGFLERVARDSTAFTLPNGLFRVDAQGRRLVAAASGTKRIVVIPALFADSPEPHIPSDTIQARLFDGPAPRGTLTAAYLEMSRGMLTVTGDVMPWVRTSLTRAEVVGTSSGLGEDAQVGAFLLEALRAVDADVDFGLYDNDGEDGLPNSGDDNGFVDAVAFEFIEVAASCGGPGIWPHLWGISPQNGGVPYVTDDERPDGSLIRVDAYIIQSAVDCGGADAQDASVIAHEFGHVLGLPDYYHPTDASAGSFGRRWVLGCWELMAAGAWGCGPHGEDRTPFGPTHFSARTKNRLDWVTYVDVGRVRDTLIELPPVQQSGLALRVPLDGVGNEFLLMEYRTRTGFDAPLPAEGVLVYHQDFQGRLRPDPASGAPYFLRLLEHDDNDGLVRNSLEGGNRGEAGDAWGVDGAVDRLNALTSPSTRRNNGVPSTVTVHAISVKGGVARIRLSTDPSPAVVLPAAPFVVDQVNRFEKRVLVAGGTLPYTVEGTVPEGVDLSADQDEVVVSGALAEPGITQLALRVRDALGLASPQVTIPLSVGAWAPEEARLLQRFFASAAAPLTADEEAYLDFVGNRNGRYDVGDLRAWLRTSGGG